MNFLIFRDLCEIFLSFYEFIWIYFELKRIKNIFLSHHDETADVADNVSWTHSFSSL